MGLFSNLMDKVFGRDDAVAEKTEAANPGPPKPEIVEEEFVDGVDLNADTVPLNDDTGAVSTQETKVEAEAAPEPVAEVDVAERLDCLAKEHPEDLDWKVSIVDLCKLLDIDSSYGARKEMALELGYTQEKIDSDGSAEMNMWLHKEVMRKISENGGKIPDGLLD
jgi:hypothetical protein